MTLLTAINMVLILGNVAFAIVIWPHKSAYVCLGAATVCAVTTLAAVTA